jgi:hypothetical protein
MGKKHPKKKHTDEPETPAPAPEPEPPTPDDGAASDDGMPAPENDGGAVEGDKPFST